MKSLIAVFLFAACGAHAQCTRECLRGLLDSYLAAMSKHDPAKAPVAAGVKFTENGQAMKLGEGLWKTAGLATSRIYAMDRHGGQAAVEAVVRENGALDNFMLRIRVVNQKITEAETIVARKGQAIFFAPQKLVANPLYLQMVPTAERTSRKEMLAAADAYFTAIQTEGTPQYKPAPLAGDANRFENGEQTTNVPIMNLPAASAAEQLEKGYFKSLTVGHRRFPVVDEDHGLVLGIGLMRTGPGGVLLAEMFKIAGGKIQQIQAVMVNHPPNGPTGWN